MSDKLESLYNVAKEEFEIGSLDEFKYNMQVPDARKNFFSAASEVIDLGDESSFNTNMNKALYSNELTQFGRSLWHNLIPSTYANYQSLLGNEEEAKQIRMQSAGSNPINPESKSAEIGGFVGSLLPTAGALAATLAPEPVTTAVGLTYLAHTGAQMGGLARSEISEYEKSTGKEVSPVHEGLIVTGYAVSGIALEALGLKALKYLGKTMGPLAAKQIGKAFADGQIKTATKLMLSSIGQMMEGGLTEGTQEAFEQGIQNALTSTYNEHRELSKDVSSSAIQGFAGGMLLSKFSSFIQKKVNQKNSPEITTEEANITDATLVNKTDDTQVVENTESKSEESLKKVDESHQIKEAELHFKNNLTKTIEDKSRSKISLPIPPKVNALNTEYNKKAVHDFAKVVVEEGTVEENSSNFTTAIESNTELNDNQTDATVEINMDKVKKAPDDQKLSVFNDEVLKSGYKIINFTKKLRNSLSIEYKFKQIGGESLGLAVKRYPAIRAAESDRVVNLLKRVANLSNYDFNLMNQAMIDAQYINRPGYLDTLSKGSKESAILIRNYFDWALDELKGRKILKKGFYERLIDDVDTTLANRRTELELEGKLDTKEWGRIQIEAEVLKTTLSELDYVHIPIGIWLTDAFTKTPGSPIVSSTLNWITPKKRKSLSLETLIEKGVIEKGDINIVDILGSYAKRLGQDFASWEIKNAAMNDKLASTTPQNGFVKEYHRPSSVFRGLHVHRIVADFLDEFGKRRDSNVIRNVFTTVKGLAFANPIYLPVLSMYQQAMINLTRLPQTWGKYGEALKHVRDRDDVFILASQHGLFSTISENPWSDQKKFLTSMVMDNKSKLGKVLRDLGSPRILKTIYNASWSSAWFMDRIVRTATYLDLMQQGLSSLDAAQTAAKAHGDYANIPTETRRTLNMLFFTPSFKISMFKLQGEMIKNLLNYKNLGTTDIAKKKMAMGVINTTALLLGQHILATSLGFETDELGFKYNKRVDTDEGKRDLIWAFSTPANMVLKYYHRVNDILHNYHSNMGKTAISRFKWDIHPVYRIAYEILIENRQYNGKRIYSPLDDNLTIASKASWYCIKNATALFSMFEKDETQQEGNEVFANELNKMIGATRHMVTLLTGITSYKYLRTDEGRRDAIVILSTLAEAEELVKNGELTQRNIQKMKRILEEVADKER